MIDAIHGGCKLCEELIAFFREHCSLRACEQQRNVVALHRSECFEHPVQDLPDFPQRRLFIVERIQQSENKRYAGIDAVKECGQFCRDGGFHLIAGKAAGDKDAVQQRIGINAPLPRTINNSVYVKPVTTVHNGNGDPLAQHLCRNSQREPEDNRIAVHEIQLSRWLCKQLQQRLRMRGENRARI